MWRLELASEAERQLERLPDAVLDRLDAALIALSRDPQVGKALVGDWAGCRSYRVGLYRVIYRIEPQAQVIYVLAIAKRARAYRRG